MDGLFHIAFKHHLALIQHDTAVTELTDGIHIVGNIQNSASLLFGGSAHFFQTLFLEGHITNRQDFVHDHDLTIQVGCHGEGQLDIHTGRITLDGGINKLPHLGKFDDVLHLGIDLRLGHAKDGAVHIHIFPAGHFTIEAGTHFQHGSDAAIDVDHAFRRCGDPAQQLQHGAFAGAVAADDAQGFALVHRQIDAVERHKGLPHQPLGATDLAVGIFLAPDTGPPTLQIPLQRAAADLTQLVHFLDTGKPNGDFSVFHISPSLHRVHKGLFDLVKDHNAN